MNYHRLTPEAKQTIHAAGLSIVDYVRSQFPDGEWHGDLCGCSDDRCMDGYHHDPEDECGCLPVILGQIRVSKP
jgi:hypothetical protein